MGVWSPWVSPLPMQGRALIDWDYGAGGIWNIPLPGGVRSGNPSKLLSEGLRGILHAWNICGEVLDRGKVVEDPLPAFFYTSARWLAERAQEELGSSWDVLWVGQDLAWHWVMPPVAWQSLNRG